MAIQRFFETHMFLVYFIYGLSFFLLGFAIALQVRRYRKESELRLGHFLWLLAGFGLLHGLAEWSTMHLMLEGKNLSKGTLDILYFLDNFIMASSYIFLYFFGVRLISERLPKLAWLRVVPVITFVGWISLTLYIFFNPEKTGISLIAASRIYIRYFLAFPAGMLSALALYLQYHELKNRVSKTVRRNFLMAAMVMAAYGSVAGLIVRKNPFIPQFFITEDFFFGVFGIPVQVVRALSGILLAYYIIKGLDVFEEENHKKMEQIEKERLLYQERCRISRDLHDGIIQSVYGVGLRLENASYLIDESPQEAKGQISATLQDLNKIIEDLRQYILGLRPSDFQERDLVKGTQALLEKFKANSLIHVDFIFYGEPRKNLLPWQCSNYYHILQEILNNILKHARATLVDVTMSFKENAVELVLWDNGVGFDPEQVLDNNTVQGEHQGLKNIRERADLLGADLKINSWPNRGTIVRLTIPEGGKEDE